MRTIFDATKPATRKDLERMSDAAARLVALCSPTTEFQGAKLSFDFRVVGPKLLLQNLVLEVGPPTKLIIQ